MNVARRARLRAARKDVTAYLNEHELFVRDCRGGADRVRNQRALGEHEGCTKLFAYNMLLRPTTRSKQGPARRHRAPAPDSSGPRQHGRHETAHRGSFEDA